MIWINKICFFFVAWGWVDVDHSTIKRSENTLLEVHKPEIDEIILSRSHAGHAHEILRNIYHDKQYKIIPAAGSGLLKIFFSFFLF